MSLNIFFTKRNSKNIGSFGKMSFLAKYFEDLGFDVEHQDSFEISKEDVEVLLSRCKQVLKKHSLAEELLPTTEGFFFGSTDYDEAYFNNVKVVRDYVKNTLLPQFDELKEDEKIYFEILYNE